MEKLTAKVEEARNVEREISRLNDLTEEAIYYHICPLCYKRMTGFFLGWLRCKSCKKIYAVRDIGI